MGAGAAGLGAQLLQGARVPAQAVHKQILEIVEVIREVRAQRGRQHRTPAIETLRHLLQEPRQVACFTVPERPKADRAIYQTLERVKSSGGAAYLLTVPGLIACIDVRLFDTSSCPLSPPSTFDKLLEIERTSLLVPCPVCGQRQAEVEQRMVVARDVPHKDPDLAVVDFASVATPLALDAYRVDASLREAPGIKGDHAIGFPQALDHCCDSHRDPRPVVPGSGADEVLQDQALDIDERRDVLSMLAWCQRLRENAGTLIGSRALAAYGDVDGPSAAHNHPWSRTWTARLLRRSDTSASAHGCAGTRSVRLGGAGSVG